MPPKIPATMNLKQFMLRQKVLKLYRDILREIRRVPDEGSKAELRLWARSDFRKYQNEKDEYAIKMLIFNGERSLKELKQSIELSSAKNN
ncbi:LYR motif-containing protein 2 [Schistocerca americana]|uniref:LYR motif-containing protein 2 n=1 Tax=Schistocerca americana TaxID=7009 RepID=UPI001F4FDEF8|nr:LYR motif-containing protein 2 [Schistocerca americana]XP_049783229.1 LYR motif-containing protein 2 [Schistocerca cancellata]XP_049783230.1 LYR motif-containing protein 2 [Schistocerca cancellata]XP_049806302.1 LYR motif-containing protein 2 [Schistocerca nitens]XP_049847286.1 LYR motif-containing protein 2 [Schistocerca gregaria]XP_049953097.1 LYR motif-containing protein 2 [Schistocerca serialis cubense]